MTALLPYLIGFLAASIVWAIACIWFLRNHHKHALEAANDQYTRGYEHGRKSATLYPHAK